MANFEERKKWYMAFAMFVQMVDANNGEVVINDGKINRVFNDADETVMVEYADGRTESLADAKFNVMDAAIKKWRDENPKKFNMLFR